MQSPYEQLGEEGIRALVDRFYHEMDTRPDAAKIRAMHKEDLAVITDKLALYLIGWMGGPRNYAEKYGRVIIPTAHHHLDIGEAERDAWLACMQVALDASPLDEAMVTRLMGSFGQMAEMCRRPSDRPFGS